MDIKLTKKQSIAWEILTDNFTTEMLYGGSAGGGKSFIGCLWVCVSCLNNAGTRYLIGRTVLTQLRLTTLNTLFETLQRMGLTSGNHYTYNAQSNVITFKNGSEIILKDLQYNPSDPNFDSLGGLELTGAFIDEAAQVSNLAYQVIKSRIRYKLNEYNLIPKILLTANPSNTWIKKDFYLPFIQDSLPSNKRFIASLPYDNPHLVGLILIDLKVFHKLGVVEVSEEIKSLVKLHGIHPQNIVIDSDGVGGGVADIIKGKNFVNNSKPLHNENYSNLKSQCYVKLSEMFKEGKISVNIIEPSVVEELTQELLSIKYKDVDKDNKVQIMSKDEQKKILGKSPDLADSLMMRMIYELKPKNSGRYAIARL